MPEVLFEALDNAGVDASQVDWLLLHQANIRIMETVAKRLGIPMEKVLERNDIKAREGDGKDGVAWQGV